jgi:uncharacterized protein (DUF2141 family)
MSVTESIRLAAAAVLIALAAGAIADGPGRVVVTVVGFESDTGQAMVALFDDAEDYPMRGQIADRSARVVDGQASVTFTDLAPGDYAISVFHDVNDNGELDTGFMGIPKEPIGASNDAKGRFGPPKFADARIEVTETPMEVTIHLQNL